ncbi:hypothetical protein EUGRSUZ_J02733 [Eucalyptus grandis]|uniref:Uncharacterized protein n=2 Tax=Eucalyptus grandis TaxID=71139 RepID=A0ACC3J9S5_EUCGR|nr:hypothetical protein EUGRSUZ_J02733 [Eucalyptus grandis]
MGWTEPYVIKPGGFSFKKLLSSTSLECIPITIQFLFNVRTVSSTAYTQTLKNGSGVVDTSGIPRFCSESLVL